MAKLSSLIGGGGGSIAIGETFLSQDVGNVVTRDDMTFLKAGYFETTENTYPNSSYNFIGFGAKEHETTLYSSVDNLGAMTSDDTHLFVTYGHASATGIYLPVNNGQSYTYVGAINGGGGGSSSNVGLTVMGNTIYRINSSTVYSATKTNGSSYTQIKNQSQLQLNKNNTSAIANDGTYFYILETGGDIHKYDSSWNVLGVVANINDEVLKITSGASTVHANGLYLEYYDGQFIVASRNGSNTAFYGVLDEGFNYTGVKVLEGYNARGFGIINGYFYTQDDASAPKTRSYPIQKGYGIGAGSPNASLFYYVRVA